MITIKGYRCKGGAIVRVGRGDRVRRYRVSGRRFRALRMLFAGAIGWHGYFGSSTLDICFDPKTLGQIRATRQQPRNRPDGLPTASPRPHRPAPLPTTPTPAMGASARPIVTGA